MAVVVKSDASTFHQLDSFVENVLRHTRRPDQVIVVAVGDLGSVALAASRTRCEQWGVDFQVVVAPSEEGFVPVPASHVLQQLSLDSVVLCVHYHDGALRDSSGTPVTVDVARVKWRWDRRRLPWRFTLHPESATINIG